MDAATIVTRAPDMLSTVLGGEAVLLSLESGTYFGTNEVGTRVWSLISDPVSVESICSALDAEFDVGEDGCERDVLAFLQRLLDEGLIVVAG